MNEEHRQKVYDYLNSEYIKSTSPLLFKDYQSPNEEFDPSKYSVNDMVRRVLILSNNYFSVNSENNSIETCSERWRSSLDIWRHIKYYYPEITIFDVMTAIYDIRGELGGQYCSFIKRRTFRIKGEHTFGSRSWVNNQFGIDEYGLNWKDWEDI